MSSALSFSENEMFTLSKSRNSEGLIEGLMGFFVMFLKTSRGILGYRSSQAFIVPFLDTVRLSDVTVLF